MSYYLRPIKYFNSSKLFCKVTLWNKFTVFLSIFNESSKIKSITKLTVISYTVKIKYKKKEFIMKNKILSILVVLLIAIVLPFACNAEKKQKVDKESLIVNSGNPGEEMDITKHLIKGKINIVDFYSEFCPPCVRVSPYLIELNTKRDDIVVLKVDINRPGKNRIDWKSPLAAQYKLRSIPHFKIYDENGKKILEGQEATQKVYNYFKEANIKSR